jgi:signal peptidase I
MPESGITEKRRRFFSRRFLWTERRRVNRLAFVFFWSILMYFFFKFFVVSVGIVDDVSMQPTLPEGAYYLVNRYIYHFVPPERGDIVVFRGRESPSDALVKRVVGLPGETVSIRSGQVYINGRPMVEPYAVGATYPDLDPNPLRKDTYFVLGDNRKVSQDSRHFGAVPLKDIGGKIKPGVLFPFR